jgi:hypothetical protein
MPNLKRSIAICDHLNDELYMLPCWDSRENSKESPDYIIIRREMPSAPSTRFHKTIMERGSGHFKNWTNWFPPYINIHNYIYTDYANNVTYVSEPKDEEDQTQKKYSFR